MERCGRRSSSICWKKRGVLPSVYNDTLSGLHDVVQVSPLTFKSNGIVRVEEYAG